MAINTAYEAYRKSDSEYIEGIETPHGRVKILFEAVVDNVDNLIESHPEKARLLKSLLAQFNSEQADPVVPSAFEVPILIDKYDGQKYEEGDDYIYWSN